MPRYKQTMRKIHGLAPPDSLGQIRARVAAAAVIRMNLPSLIPIGPRGKGAPWNQDRSIPRLHVSMVMQGGGGVVEPLGVLEPHP